MHFKNKISIIIISNETFFIKKAYDYKTLKLISN
jgi:hypothetical protein